MPSINCCALAAYGQSSKSTTRKIYGPRIRAKSILAGGQSGDPQSPHFRDQAAMYARGEFKDVLFYPEQVEQHLERRYRPGE